MTYYQEEDLLELLNNMFVQCDIHESGVVSVDSLITILTSQEHSWQGNKEIENEFRKLLCSDDTTQVITQSQFTSALLNKFKTYYGHEQETREEGESLPDESDGKSSSHSSDITKDITQPSSFSSPDENYFADVQFVSDGQSFSSDDVVDNFSVEDIESPRCQKKLLKSLESKVESMEHTERTLLDQISALEENLTKNENESSAQLKKVQSQAALLKQFKQKQEEADERLNMVIEEKKSVTIQLCQCERENSKLKELITSLEKQVDTLSNEKLDQHDKIQTYNERIADLSDKLNRSQEGLEALRSKEESDKNALKDMLEQNKTLQSQLDSNTLLIQDLKADLTSAHKELSTFKMNNITSRLQRETSTDGSTTENSMTLFDNSYTLDDSIPLGSSLLAELQDKVKCVCFKRQPLSSSSSISSYSDYGNSPEKESLIDSGTMTALWDFKEDINSPQVMYKDVGVNCSLKTPQKIVNLKKNCEICHLKSKRSLTKWMSLGLILVLVSFLIGFTCSSTLMLRSLLHSPRPKYCISSLFDLLPVALQHLDIPR